MTTLTTHAPGTFCWPELMTTDTDGARKFYGGLFGWTVSELPLGPNDPPYLIFQKDGRDVAAGYVLQPEQKAQGVPPYWGNYLSVTNAEQTTAKAKELGATVLIPPMDVMDKGVAVMLQDPFGAVFGLWQAKSHIGAQVLDEPGALCWTECYTLDQEKAKDFYTKLVGWSAADMPMEKMVYTMFKRPDGASAAGLMKVPAEAQGMPPNWLSYFQTTDLEKSTDQVKALGGTVVVGPMPVPNIGAFSIVTDPQGATFGLFQS